MNDAGAGIMYRFVWFSPAKPASANIDIPQPLVKDAEIGSSESQARPSQGPKCVGLPPVMGNGVSDLADTYVVYNTTDLRGIHVIDFGG
jgi:hypothetical protein